MSNETENTKHEVLHLHVGSGGIAVGNDCWQLYCLEHNLDIDGCISSEEKPPLCFFSAGDHEKKFRPRTLFIDQDSTTIDRIKTSRMKNFYTDDQFLVSADSILNKIRKEIEVYDYFQGFIFSHSTYGKC
jgi:tubulin alpha